MVPALDERPARPALEVVVQILWVVGAMAAYFAGALLDAALAVGVLVATFCLALPLAKVARGWAAFPALCAALAVQAPLVVGLGLYALALPLGDDPYPCFFWSGTDLQQLEAFTVVAAVSAPVAALLRVGPGGLRRLRWVARRAAPLAVVGAGILAALGAYRIARFPTPDRYVESLPLHTTIPSPKGQPCERIRHERDPAHLDGWEREECATPEWEARPVAFHYHADPSRKPDERSYSLRHRSADGKDHIAAVWLSASRVADLPIRRDDSLGAFFIEGGGRFGVVSPDASRWQVSLREIRGRVAPPRAWWWASLAGLAIALACFGGSAALGDVASGAGEARAAWIAARRGDLSLAALAAVACSSALLVAALLAGFLT